MIKLLKTISHFFIKDPERIRTPIWGLVPVGEMSAQEVLRFVDEFSDSMVALSLNGFEIVYDMSPGEPVVLIRQVL